MRIATWNIDDLNSRNMARRNELVRWLCKNQPDVMGPQETKTDDHEFIELNKGLRLDLVFGNRAIVDRLRSCRIAHSPYEERDKTGRPDHAPVVVELA